MTLKQRDTLLILKVATVAEMLRRYESLICVRHECKHKFRRQKCQKLKVAAPQSRKVLRSKLVFAGKRTKISQRNSIHDEEEESLALPVHVITPQS